MPSVGGGHWPPLSLMAGPRDLRSPTRIIKFWNGGDCENLLGVGILSTDDIFRSDLNSFL